MSQNFIEFTEAKTNNKIIVPVDRLLYVGYDSVADAALIGVDCIKDERIINVSDKYEDIKECIKNV